MYEVKLKLTANNENNSTVQYYNIDAPKAIFEKYVNEGKLTYETDSIQSNERYQTLLFDTEESYKKLRAEVEECEKNNPGCINDVDVEFLKEGYRIEI